MNGLVVGLDMRDALASLPRNADRDLARKYLMRAEREFVGAMMETAKDGKGK